MYSFPQSGIISQYPLNKRLVIDVYFPVTYTPGKYTHQTMDTSFTLVVDDFDVKYTSKENTSHLLNCLKRNYLLVTDYSGSLHIYIYIYYS